VTRLRYPWPFMHPQISKSMVVECGHLAGHSRTIGIVRKNLVVPLSCTENRKRWGESFREWLF
jgi:hypothetical protein